MDRSRTDAADRRALGDDRDWPDLPVAPGPAYERDSEDSPRPCWRTGDGAGGWLLGTSSGAHQAVRGDAGPPPGTLLDPLPRIS